MSPMNWRTFRRVWGPHNLSVSWMPAVMPIISVVVCGSCRCLNRRFCPRAQPSFLDWLSWYLGLMRGDELGHLTWTLSHPTPAKGSQEVSECFSYTLSELILWTDLKTEKNIVSFGLQLRCMYIKLSVGWSELFKTWTCACVRSFSPALVFVQLCELSPVHLKIWRLLLNRKGYQSFPLHSRILHVS